MRRKLIVGNWKMHKTVTEAQQDFVRFAELAGALATDMDLGISAPAISLPALAATAGRVVSVYAQNSHWEAQGAFTGEVSVPMLKDLGIAGSVIGHSERRQYFGETNETAGKRVAALLKSGMEAIFCIGETLQEREAGMLEKVLRDQLIQGFAAGELVQGREVIGSNPIRPLLSVAYEPVWAIGTGKAASPVEAAEAHALVRKVLAEVFDVDTAARVRILYGGSVKPENVATYFQVPDVDGALVGGASLKPEAFAELGTKGRV